MMKHSKGTIISRILSVKRLDFRPQTFQFSFSYYLIHAVNGSQTCFRITEKPR